MQVPIPDDWNGEKWKCYQIEWPDSPQWTAIFLGLLTYATRGRYWDGNSGSIIGAQSIGMDIYGKNYPFRDCEGLVNESDDGGGTVIAGASSLVDYLERLTDMSLCGYNPKAFKIEDGSLWVRDFCGEWVKIGETTSAQEPDGDIITPPPAGNVNTTACAMASKAAALLVNIATVAVGEADVTFDPFDYSTDLIDAFPGLNFDERDIARSFVSAKEIDLGGWQGEAYADIIVEYLQCHFAPLITASQSGITQAEYSAMRDAITPAITAYYADHIQEPFAVWGNVLTTLYKWLFEAVGAGDWRKVTYGAQPIAGVDCACPEPVVPYSGTVWFADNRVLTVGLPATFYSATLETSNEISYYFGGNIQNVYQEWSWNEYLKASGTIQELEIQLPEYQPSAMPDHYPAESWSDVSPTELSNYWKPIVGGANQPDETIYDPVENAQRVTFKWNAPVNLEGHYIKLAHKSNPKDQQSTVGGPQRFYITFKLTYAGGLR